MALEHAILVSLRERPAAGLDLARQFDRSLGYFWNATHQQIYRVLARMEADGWVRSSTEAHPGGPARKVYAVTDAGAQQLADWLAAPTPLDRTRSELAVKLRGAAYGDRSAVRATVEAQLAEHRDRLAEYQRMAARDFPDPDRLDGHARDVYLVLRGGIRLERFWVEWLEEYLEGTAHPDDTDRTPHPDVPAATTGSSR